MNNVSEKQKESVTKTLAIAGFVAIILFIVWLAVQIVSLVPSAFSSLASIADSVYGTSNKELVVATKNSVVNSGESFTVSWTQLPGNGTYTFAYKCAEGVAVDLRKGSGGIVSVACDTAFDMGDETSVDMLVTSEKQRFTDIHYTLTYTAEGLTENIVGSSVVTIVNASIPTVVATTDDSDDDNENVAEVEEETETPVTQTPATPTTPTLTPGKPTTIETIVYKIPVSDPNGKVDLQVTHLGVGTLSGNVFIPTARIDKDKKGAIQFEIKNVGTKTATNWSYEATLPSDIRYDSGAQKALKPNEKAVITLGFEGITRTGTERFGVEVTASGDVKKSNNEYTWSIKVVD